MPDMQRTGVFEILRPILNMSENNNTHNHGFFDLDPEDRAYWYDVAREETGEDFFDLDPEIRGRYYERATQGIR